MAKERTYAIEASEIDLENETVHDSQGRRVDAAYVDGAVRNVHEHLKNKGGRPSLSGASARSPQVTFRVPAEVKAAAEARAIREGTTISAMAREAFKRYLAS
jgi:hypothetical protein